MTKRFAKLACLFTALALMLTGCSLIKVDPIMQADEDMEALQKDYAQTIVTYDGGVITKGDIVADYLYNYSYLSYMYSIYYGTSVDDSQLESIAQSVAQSYVRTHAVLKKADELGITLTEDEIAECEQSAQTSYDDAYQNAYDKTTGETEEVHVKNAEYYLASQGTTYDYYYKQQTWSKLLDKVEQQVKAEKSELSDEELATMFAAQTQEDEKTYSEDTASFEQNMTKSDTFITYMPEGYRTVKHILVKPADDVLQAATDARDAYKTANSELATLNNELANLGTEDSTSTRTEEEVQADIDAKKAEIEEKKADMEAKEAACVADVQDKLDEIYAKLDAGENFDDVMAEYGEDPGMQEEPAKTRGYYVSMASTTWDTNFRNAAMALEKVGDYSAEPVVSSSGVHIIYYNSDVTPGALNLDDVKDEYSPFALEQAQTDYFESQADAWTEALNPQYDLSKFFAEN